MIIALMILSAVVVVVLRFLVPGHDISPAGTYEAFAHILMGALLLATFDNRNKKIIRRLLIWIPQSYGPGSIAHTDERDARRILERGFILRIVALVCWLLPSVFELWMFLNR